MDISVSLSEAREKMSELLEKVSADSERVTITKRGYGTAAIVPLSDLVILQELETHLDIEEAKEAYEESLTKGTISLEELKEKLKL